MFDRFEPLSVRHRRRRVRRHLRSLSPGRSEPAGVCAADFDGDGIGDASDNCPQAPNPDQDDGDDDGTGDACTNDTDGDGLPNGSDECRLLPNPKQRDTNGDGVGNRCWSDRDRDGVADRLDACPDRYNLPRTPCARKSATTASN
ncbi:MAG: thrombospondin type 3 repeat-containing protein [Bradymonadaceae bacterium]